MGSSKGEAVRIGQPGESMTVPDRSPSRDHIKPTWD
jgi:hypothetical protein